jgi:DNA-directed RNA polymerase specialized sigma24 family protein
MLVIWSYFEKLLSREADLLEMSFVLGLETGECARRLKLGAGAVRTLKSRAIRRLRKIINEEEVALTKL